jgi:hypothetical protein
MVVLVTPDTEYMRKDLESFGYTVVKLGQYNYPIDAMIYHGYSPDSSYISYNNMPTNDLGRNYGILMINAQNKKISEIDEILKSRVYSPLF